jgi:hypothetical protein
MKKCEECSKNLGLLAGYYHPSLGKKYLVCSGCFNDVSESVEKYREFLSPYNEFFTSKPEKIGIQDRLNYVLSTIKLSKNKINYFISHNFKL